MQTQQGVNRQHCTGGGYEVISSMFVRWLSGTTTFELQRYTVWCTHMHTYTHTCTHKHTDTQTHARTHTYVNTHIHTHTRTHACTHARMHTHTITRTYTQTICIMFLKTSTTTTGHVTRSTNSTTAYSEQVRTAHRFRQVPAPGINYFPSSVKIAE